MRSYTERYVQAIHIGHYILSDHNYEEAAKKFKISVRTVGRRMHILRKEEKAMYNEIVEEYPLRRIKT